VARAGGEKAHIILVPCAGFRVGDYDDEEEFLSAVTRRYGSWVSLERNGHVASFRFLFTDSPDDANDEDFVEPLKKATGVWFSGGAQERLNYRFVEFPRPTLFQRELKRVLERGGVVGGTSAGTAAMPEVMTIREYRSGDDPCEAVLAHGLGLCDRVIVEQHFDGRNGRFERFFNTLRDSNKLDRYASYEGAGRQMLGVAAEEGTAVLLQGNRIAALGLGKGHLFLKSPDGRSLTWHEIAPGERGTVQREEDGLARLLRDSLGK
jgi:cyanophycinase